MMGLTRCYKTAVFLHFIFAAFRSQSIAEILPLPHLENKRTPYGNSTSGFDEPFTIIGIVRFCTSLPNFMQIG